MTTDAITRGQEGLVIVLTGHGKGKTTSALGMALRASGHDMKVCVIQFVKGHGVSGEIRAIQKVLPAIEVYCGGKGFVGIRGDQRRRGEHRAEAQAAMTLALGKIASPDYDVVVLDEIHNAVALGLVDIAQVLDLIAGKPGHLHLILTGRDAHPSVIARADLVTEMKEITHPYTRQRGPFKGIDY